MAEKVYQVRNIYKCIHEKAGEKKTFTVRVPGSKSITNRALLLSMLSDGDCVLKGALFSDDSRYLVQCIADLGFAITADEAAEEIRVRGLGGRIPKRKHPFTLEAQERPPVPDGASGFEGGRLASGCFGADAQEAYGAAARLPENAGNTGDL